MLVDYTKSPTAFAGFYLFYNIMYKLYFTNNGINFFLYVISGKKFSNDLRKLLKCQSDRVKDLRVQRVQKCQTLNRKRINDCETLFDLFPNWQNAPLLPSANGTCIRWA